MQRHCDLQLNLHHKTDILRAFSVLRSLHEKYLTHSISRQRIIQMRNNLTSAGDAIHTFHFHSLSTRLWDTSWYCGLKSSPPNPSTPLPIIKLYGAFLSKEIPATYLLKQPPRCQFSHYIFHTLTNLELNPSSQSENLLTRCLVDSTAPLPIWSSLSLSFYLLLNTTIRFFFFPWLFATNLNYLLQNSPQRLV